MLARFAMSGFSAAQTALPLALSMLVVYLMGRRFMPRYAVVATLLAGVVYAAFCSELAWSAVSFSFTMPVFVIPLFSVSAVISLAIPLFVVTMASQNLPGVAAIRATGYEGQIPLSKVITMTGVATLLLAPFGGFALNLSAITAAIVMGKEAHVDPDKRYTAAVSCGAIYLVIGVFGAAVTSLLAAFPKELVAAIAGLALLGTIGAGLAAAVKDEVHR